MSLDTVLKIGKALRNATDNLKHFKYVSPCPTDKDGNYPFCISVPVLENFSFDWNKITAISSEVKKDKLVYLKFSTSDSDSSAKKFVFGDIYYKRESQFDKAKKIKKTIEYGGCFTIDKGNAFENSKNARQNIRTIAENYIISNLLSSVQKNTLKSEISNYIKKGDKYKVLKKFAKEKDVITELGESVSEKIIGLPLLKFWDAFSKDLDKVLKTLRYAPAFEYALTESLYSTSIFEDEHKINEYYFHGLFNNYFQKASNFLLKNETLNNLSEVTKQKLLNYGYSEVFIHFDFQGKSWENLSESFNAIIDYLNSEISENTDYGIVLSKSVYRTLCSGDEKNDWQFPYFSTAKKYQSFAFSENAFKDFLYTDNFVKTPRYRLTGTGIAIYVLPNIIDESEEISQNEKADEYKRFLNDRDENRFFNYEPLFPFEDDEIPQAIKKFDFILSDTSGKTVKDIVEISGIDRSYFFKIKKEIEELEKQISKELKEVLNRKEAGYISIEKALKFILGDILESEKKKSIDIKEGAKYKAHILKILPKIYVRDYHQDDSLLIGMIENIQSIVRKKEDFMIWISSKKGNKNAIGVNANWQKYQLLKHSFKLFISIQKTNNMDKISESPNYQIGKKIGRLARPLKKAINSFEKSYVGLLSRRVNTLNDCMAFINEIDEMLTRHSKTWAQTSAEARQMLAELSEKSYDKELLAFGFFEGYFTYEVSDDKKKLLDKLEKLLSDYEDKAEFEKFLEPIVNIIDDIKAEK